MAKSAAQKAAEAKEKQAALEEAAGESTGSIGQRKVGRGSTRRIVKALNAFEEASKALMKELDLQIYVMDEDCKRVGPWPMLEQIAPIPNGIRKEVMAVLNGPAEETETEAAE